MVEGRSDHNKAETKGCDSSEGMEEVAGKLQMPTEVVRKRRVLTRGIAMRG